MVDEQTKTPTRGAIAKAKGLQQLTIELPRDCLRQLDHLAVERGTRRKGLVQQVIEEYLSRHPYRQQR